MNHPTRMVTVSREFGSGGGAMAARVADLLGWRLVDRDLIGAVAERLGVPEHEVAPRDEHIAGIAERVGTYLADAFPEMLIPPPPEPPVDDRTVRVLVEATLREAAVSPLVVVGHGAQCIFADLPGTLHVRVWAPLDERVRRVAERLALRTREARARTLREDAARRDYLRHHYDIDVAAVRHYDLILNTGRIAVEDAATALAEIVTQGRHEDGA